MSLLLATTGALSAAAEGAPVLHATGRDLEINGISELPARLFSIHHGPEATPELVADWGLEGVRVIQHVPTGQVSRTGAPFTLDCLFDRYQPATLLFDPQWEANLDRLATGVAKGIADDAAGTRAVEFWNEPYLNWAAKPGVNFDGLYYDQTRAVAGGPVHDLKTGEVLPGLVWDAPRTVAYAEFPHKPDYVATRFMPSTVKAGEDFLWRGRPFHTCSRWWVRDVGQPSWWAGPTCLRYYLQMAVPFAKKVKEVAPDAPLVVGWGFHLFEGDWKSWDVVHRETMDTLAPWMDGYGEHHYAINPQRVAMSYEIGWAYMMGMHGRNIGFWNTEAGGIQDPERPDSIYPLPGDRRSSRAKESRGALTYFLRDILTLLRTVPDKAKMRCAHEPQSTPGVPAGFRLLAPLRGTLSETISPEPDIFAVAARKGDRFTVVCYNGTRNEVTRSVRVDAPAGTKLVAMRQQELLESSAEGDYKLEEKETTLAADTAMWEGEVVLPAGLAVCLVFTLDGEAAPAVLKSQQFVGKDVFQKVGSESPTFFRIPLPKEALEKAKSAKVRWVYSRGGVPVAVMCNGKSATSGAWIPPILEATIPLESLRAGENSIGFLAAEGSAEIGTASLVLQY